jgi:hypothetical protein
MIKEWLYVKTRTQACGYLRLSKKSGNSYWKLLLISCNVSSKLFGDEEFRANIGLN